MPGRPPAGPRPAHGDQPRVVVQEAYDRARDSAAEIEEAPATVEHLVPFRVGAHARDEALPAELGPRVAGRVDGQRQARGAIDLPVRRRRCVKQAREDPGPHPGGREAIDDPLMDAVLKQRRMLVTHPHMLVLATGEDTDRQQRGAGLIDDVAIKARLAGEIGRGRRLPAARQESRRDRALKNSGFLDPRTQHVKGRKGRLPAIAHIYLRSSQFSNIAYPAVIAPAARLPLGTGQARRGGPVQIEPAQVLAHLGRGLTGTSRLTSSDSHSQRAIGTTSSARPR